MDHLTTSAYQIWKKKYQTIPFMFSRAERMRMRLIFAQSWFKWLQGRSVYNVITEIIPLGNTAWTKICNIWLHTQNTLGVSWQYPVIGGLGLVFRDDKML